MKVFVTGVTGYIGGSVAKALIEARHKVYGLVRDSQKAELLSNLGIEPVLGTLEDTDILTEYARLADGVIHTADADYRPAVETFIHALRGSGKPFLHTSGSSVVGDDARGEYESQCIYTDETPFTPIDIRKNRTDINKLVRRAGVDEGIRAIVICPSMIYGEGLGLTTESDQIPKLMCQSRKVGAGVYVGKGVNRWSNVHIKDVTTLYLLALEKAPSASMFFIENGEESLMAIAKSISKALGFGGKTISWSIDNAIRELGDWARFALASNSRVRAVNARNLLGWKPVEKSILRWMEK